MQRNTKSADFRHEPRPADGLHVGWKRRKIPFCPNSTFNLFSAKCIRKCECLPSSADGRKTLRDIALTNNY